MRWAVSWEPSRGCAALRSRQSPRKTVAERRRDFAAFACVYDRCERLEAPVDARKHRALGVGAHLHASSCLGCSRSRRFGPIDTGLWRLPCEDATHSTCVGEHGRSRMAPLMQASASRPWLLPGNDQKCSSNAAETADRRWPTCLRIAAMLRPLRQRRPGPTHLSGPPGLHRPRIPARSPYDVSQGHGQPGEVQIPLVC